MRWTATLPAAESVTSCTREPTPLRERWRAALTASRVHGIACQLSAACPLRCLRPASSPRPLKAPACRAGVLGVAVAEVVLDQPKVMALVGEGMSAGVAQRVRMHARQAGASGREAHEVADGLPGDSPSILASPPRNPIRATPESGAVSGHADVRGKSEPSSELGHRPRSGAGFWAT